MSVGSEVKLSPAILGKPFEPEANDQKSQLKVPQIPIKAESSAPSTYKPETIASSSGTTEGKVEPKVLTAEANITSSVNTGRSMEVNFTTETNVARTGNERPVSSTVNRTHQSLQLPCRNQTNVFLVPVDRESYLIISKGRSKQKTHSMYSKYEDSCCFAFLIPEKSFERKFISLIINPLQSTSSGKDTPWMRLNNKLVIVSYDKQVLFHSRSNAASVEIRFIEQSEPFRVAITLRTLPQNGATSLHVLYHTNVSGTITPYGFDGFSDYAKYMYAGALLVSPPGHRLMLSFPHFHLDRLPSCRAVLLELFLPNGNSTYNRYWRRCGTLQLPPELYVYNDMYYFNFITQAETGFSGFEMRFSFHDTAELPEKSLATDATAAVFNCSVPFYAKFSQHLQCNLETECVQSEDEVGCSFWQGGCQSGFLNAGGKCYKYVKTRKRMTWFEAFTVCLKQGLTLASFPTFTQGEAFRDGILRYAPTTFNVFIGLRTSEQSLLFSTYREVWQWSSGIMAYYVRIDEQQLFKPTCASFAALSRDKISTTMCGFYEYMHFIFCESETATTIQSHKNNLLHADINTTFNQEKRPHFVACPGGHLTHDFLACDYMSRCSEDPAIKSCVTHSPVEAGTVGRRVEVLMFICDSQTQSIHYTQVCDHQPHCLDSSDESFCIHRPCLEKQCLNHQCVKDTEWCDGKVHCSDGSDEACPQHVTGSVKPHSTSKSGFRVVQFDGYGKFKYIPQGKECPVCPQTHFLCANRELCLPVYLRCNGIDDCAEREDEHNCDNATCPGFYRCRQSAVCVHFDHVCDGVFQCPQQDDELLCHMTCPQNCQCQGLAFICPRSFPVEFYSDLRYLDSPGSGLSPDRVFRNHYIIRLSLSRCSLYTLPVLKFPNLKFLYLDNNLLTNVTMRALLELSNLNFISLSRNPLVKFTAFCPNFLLEHVHSLDLSFTELSYFESAMLGNVRNLKYLNLSHAGLKVISDSGFASLTYVKSLDMRGVELQKYPVKMLLPLSSLRVLYTGVYKLCCRDILPGHFNLHNCHTTPDEFASCKDLLRSDIYRMFLWISCCFAMIGNAVSFSAKFYTQRGRPRGSFDVFIANLNVADFFMGLYLALVGAADRVYRGTYLWHDDAWKISSGCKAAGFFSLLSCEMSAFIICFITLDRFLVMRFPFGQLRFRKTSAQVVCGLIWPVGVALAALPLLPMISHWRLYSQTGICIPLPITKKPFEGRFYSFGILIVFNFLVFVLIAVGQLFIYMSIRVNSMDTDQKTIRETTVARRLLTIVLSDFLCWFPIGLCGLLACSGVSIPGEVNVAMAIFALPLNSALNPFLYTFNLLMEKRRKAAEERLLKLLQKKYATKQLQ